MKSCYYTVGGGKGEEWITLYLDWSLDDLQKNISVHGITSFKYLWQGVTLVLLWNFLMTLRLLLIMSINLKWWIYKTAVKVHVADTCFKYTHPKVKLRMLETRDVRIAVGGCDNSEISWSTMCKNLEEKRNQRWEAQTWAANSKWLCMLLCIQGNESYKGADSDTVTTLKG